MEAVIAILVLIGVLSVTGVLPEKSQPSAVEKVQAQPLAISRPKVRLGCGPREPVYRDLTAPYQNLISLDAAANTEGRCDD
ncbi:MAG: hypothetical protein L0H73_00590 [Nitrococcus sp.]|nr:hypothetical protein [Nitrococcus sp.]